MASHSTEHLIADLWGALATTLVVLPSSIAFGVAIYAPLGPDHMGEGAVAGLVGAIVMGIVAPLAGVAPRMITAPCAPAAAVMGALCMDLAAREAAGPGVASPAAIVVALTLVAVVSGALQFAYGAIKAGRLIKYIPYPVVTGYLSGVGTIIVLKQLQPFLGTADRAGISGLVHPGEWAWQGVAAGAVTILSMLVAPRITTRVPAAIFGLAGGLAAYFALSWVDPTLLRIEGNPLVVGTLKAGGGSFWGALRERGRSLVAIDPASLRSLLPPAITLSVLLSIDTLKTGVILDALTRTRSDSNRTLLSQGAANLASALAGGVPGAGTSGPTLMNLSSGGTTRMSALAAGAMTLVAFALLRGAIAWVPRAALAGILLVVGFRMLDFSSLRLLRQRATVLDFCVVLSVVIVALRFDLVTAAGAGVALAILLFIRDQIQGQVVRRKTYGDEHFSKQLRLSSEREVLDRHGHQTVICRLQGNLFFGTTDQLFTELEADLKSCRFVVLDLKSVQGVDYTAAHMLEQVAATLAERDGRLILCNIPSALPTGRNLEAYLSQLGLASAVDGVLLFETLDDALEWGEDRILERHGFKGAPDEAALDFDGFEMLREFGPEALESLRVHVEERSYGAGEPVFHKKDKGDELFLIRRGKVRVALPLKLSGKQHHLATFARGAFFGDIAFLSGKSRTADATATAPTDVYVLPRDRFDAFSYANPELGAKFFARLATALALRLRDSDKELRRLQDT